jgi:hypothetical protein
MASASSMLAGTIGVLMTAGSPPRLAAVSRLPHRERMWIDYSLTTFFGVVF